MDGVIEWFNHMPSTDHANGSSAAGNLHTFDPEDSHDQSSGGATFSSA
jgi:hypothetical protein